MSMFAQIRDTQFTTLASLTEQFDPRAPQDAAEAHVTLPSEVTGMNGPVRVTARSGCTSDSAIFDG